MVQINWTFQARNDLKNIANYISKDSVQYARLQISRIRQRTKILTLQPLSGRMVPEKENQSIRELIEGNYRIIYRIVDEQKIDILTVHHTSRDLTGRKF